MIYKMRREYDPEPERYYDWMLWKMRQEDNENMIHKISDLCDRVNVIYEKSMNLRRLKYDTPKHKRDEIQIQYLIDDIQSICATIAADKTDYQKEEN